MIKIRSKNYALSLCAMFTAITAVLSQIAVPLPFTPVPINLATLATFLAGGLLGPVFGAVSLTTYVVLGAVGLPVFAQFTGGVGIVVGPTGGYILGYITAAWLTGLLIQKLPKGIFFSILSMSAGMLSCYLLGTAWFMFQQKVDLLAALAMCVVPFLIGDALKIVLAAFVVKAVNRFVK